MARTTDDGSGEITIDTEDGDADYAEIKKTIVGAQYNFPFKVETIKQAWNNLSNNDIDLLQPTHNYLKFTPQTLEELALLQNSGLKLFDFPLDHDIIQYGSVLNGTGESTIPTLYTFVPVGTSLPAVSHQILYGVRFIPMESIITEKAFELSGLADKYPYFRDSLSNPEFDTIPINIADLSVDQAFGWTGAEPQIWEEYTGGNGGYNNIALNFNTPTPSDVTNACNCNRNGDDRYPSGCILVEETQFAPHWAGVRNVIVDFVGPYGQYMALQTNDRGCFFSSNKIAYKVWRPFKPDLRLPVVMRVIFQSGEAKVSSLVPGTLALSTKPVCHIVGDVAPWGLNNITIRYNRSANAWQMPAVYYNAATLNNAHYEFIDMQIQDGIQRIHGSMSYLLHPFNNSGTALMMRQMVLSGSPTVNISQSTILWMFSQIPGIGFALEAYLRTNPVDIAIGYERGGNMDNHTSDRMRSIMYHELGHASHYRRSGHQFWRNLIDYETHQALTSWGSDSYGDGTAAGADRCALAEMWGEHIGLTYTHRRYGINHSRPFGGSNTAQSIQNTWFAVLERDRFRENNYIPEAALHDLMDNNVQNQQPPTFNITENANVGNGNDNVGGFTNLRFYQELDADNINAFIDRVRNNQLPATGNSVNSYNSLWERYGY